MTGLEAGRASDWHGRAGGKVILLGEHAVVYGASALAAGIQLGLSAVVRPAPSAGFSRLNMLGRTILGDPAVADPTARAWSELVAPERTALLDAQVVGELPPGVGLGFSAAAGVALARAVERSLDRPALGVRVWNRAMAWERVFHGNPSGVDVAAAMHSGIIAFSKGEGTRSVPAPCGIALCIGLSGTTASTSTMVEQVASLRRRTPSKVDHVVTAIDERVRLAEQAVVAGDPEALGGLLDEAHQLLGVLGVSTGALDRLCELARAAGALGAKLTGSGGGGAAIALAGRLDARGQAPPDVRAIVDRVLARWREAGFVAFETAVGGAPAAG